MDIRALSEVTLRKVPIVVLRHLVHNFPDVAAEFAPSTSTGFRFIELRR